MTKTTIWASHAENLTLTKTWKPLKNDLGDCFIRMTMCINEEISYQRSSLIKKQLLNKISEQFLRMHALLNHNVFFSLFFFSYFFDAMKINVLGLDEEEEKCCTLLLIQITEQLLSMDALLNHYIFFFLFFSFQFL